MDSIKRIYRACRAIIAEISPINYVISTGMLLATVALIFYSSGDGDRYKGVLGGGYFNFDPEPITALVTGVGWLAATIISGTIVKRHFKEENRAIRYLSLPLSNGERFTTLVLINWLFVSIVSFLPLVLLAFVAYFVRPDSVLMAWPGYYAHWFLVGPLVHLVTLAFWLFPTIAYTKKAGYAVVGVIVAAVIYFSNTRGDLSDVIDLDYTATAFEATDVVGLSKYQLLNKPVTEVAYVLPDPQSLQMVLIAFVAGMMLFSAYLALTRKTA